MGCLSFYKLTYWGADMGDIIKGVFSFAAVAAVGGGVVAATTLTWERVGQNESAILIKNGTIVKDNIQPGLRGVVSWPWNSMNYLKLPHISDTFTIPLSIRALIVMPIALL